MIRIAEQRAATSGNPPSLALAGAQSGEAAEKAVGIVAEMDNYSQ